MQLQHQVPGKVPEGTHTEVKVRFRKVPVQVPEGSGAESRFQEGSGAEGSDTEGVQKVPVQILRSDSGRFRCRY